MKKGKKPNPSRARASARALQKEFFEYWGDTLSVSEALKRSGVKWAQISAWKRWDHGFRGRYQEMQKFVEQVRKINREDNLWARSIAGSDRALELCFRLFHSDKLCAWCLGPRQPK